MKVRLWTIQDEKGWKELQSNGVLIAKEEFVYSDFKYGYDWMKSQMDKRIDYQSKDCQYPIWAWFQSLNENKKKPDLRNSGYLPKGEKGYRIEIEKDLKDVLLSDFSLWHVPLSYYSFIADSETESLEFEEKLKKKIENQSFSELPTTIKQKIVKSWEKIFDMDFEEEYFTKSFKYKQIQATFWELRKDDIIKIDEFKAR